MINFLKRYWKYIFFVFTLILMVLGGYWYEESNSVTTPNNKKMSVLTEDKEESKEVNTVFVDVKGAVNAPGVYEIDADRRIIDAINLAGGLLQNANTINLNLSKKVKDEMYIVVYTQAQVDNFKKEHKEEPISCAAKECVCPDVSNDACISKGEIKKEGVNSKISINNASKEELTKLPGIGDSKADAIIKYRSENEGFKQIEDIKNVSGIGELVYEKIKDSITL